MAAHRKSQVSLAAHLGVHQTYISRRMTGEVEWSAAEIVEIAAWLGVPVTALLPEPPSADRGTSRSPRARSKAAS